jgi:signal transduction histidine kinase
MPKSLARPRLRFFWQLTLAFSFIVLLVGGGMFLASQYLLGNWGGNGSESQLTQRWTDRLAQHYAQQHSWEGAATLLAGYPHSADWSQIEPPAYLLAGPDGVIVAAHDTTRVGQKLTFLERWLATPIRLNQRDVGRLLILSREQLGIQLAPGRFFMVALVLASVGVLVSVLLSRQISQPYTDLTRAMRAIAAGDLDVRVAKRYAGEAGELTEAFNQMAGELARAREQRRNLTADVAHELRTPLSVIRARLEGVLDGVYPASAEHLAPALDTLELLAHLAEDLRLLALADAGQLTLDKRPADLNGLLQDAHVSFTPQAEDRGIALTLELPAALPPALVDPRRLAQVLGNLLSNALRHTPGGGQVTLSAKETGEGQMEVTVRDTGAGIAPEDLPYIFERFWRGDKSRARTSGGSGLGLTIARQLVELHGGRLWAESAPGQGTTFRFTLPTN